MWGVVVRVTRTSPRRRRRSRAAGSRQRGTGSRLSPRRRVSRHRCVELRHRWRNRAADRPLRAAAAPAAARREPTFPRRRAPRAAGCAPRRPDSRSGWRTVVRPMAAASSMSSKPMTERSPGTASPARAAASSTPKAWTSEAAKIAGRPAAQRQQLARELEGALAAERAAPDVARAAARRRPRPARAACPPGAAGWRRSANGLSSTSPTKAMSRWPASSRWPRGHRAAGDVVDGDVGQQRVRDVDQHRRHARRGAARGPRPASAAAR